MKKIIVIDDDPDILDATSLILSSKGYEVLTAANPEDGYKSIKENLPDLIILDVMMNEPDDGFFLAQKLRRENFQIPIIMYTSISKSVGLSFSKTEFIPVDDFIEKPVAPDVILDKVEKLLQLYNVEE